MTIPETMHAVLLTGHGGFEVFAYRDDVPVPVPGPGEVLIRVGAAALNNTDINTRTGWYSRTVAEGTTADGGAGGFADADGKDAGWSRTALSFPVIQGADVCGRIVAVGDGVDAGRIGERVLVDPVLRRPVDYKPFEMSYFGAECDGGFAQYTKVWEDSAVAVDSPLGDAELASFPCSYGTAENMLTRAAVGAGETVLITGASGGVGSALVQLAARRGARVIAVAGAAKADAVSALGAAQTLDRGSDLTAALGTESVDVVADVVAGDQFDQFLEVLTRGGRYVTCGAIAGPIVSLDVRTLYLKDLTMFGASVTTTAVFRALVGHIERGEVDPLVAATYPLADIVRAQEDFLAKKYVGKLVLLPPD
jgi:NADPH:quinone reductase-like Zn-dependent oxidoreductase